MITHTIERLGTEIERDEGDVGAPCRVVEPAGDIRAESVFARVSARAVPAVVSEGDCLSKRDIEPQCTGNRCRYLSDLQRVRETRALVIVGEDEHLGLAGKPSKGVGVQDAVAVALEAGSPLVGLFRNRAVSCAEGPGGQRGE